MMWTERKGERMHSGEKYGRGKKVQTVLRTMRARLRDLFRKYCDHLDLPSRVSNANAPREVGKPRKYFRCAMRVERSRVH